MPPFNPDSSEVHPSARPAVIKFRIPAQRRRRSIAQSGSGEEFVSDESTDEEDSGGDVKRRSTRSAAARANRKLQSTLPFSPKKTRFEDRVITSHSSESENGSRHAAPPTRRSTRARKTRLQNAYDDDEYDSLSGVSEVSGPSKPVKKKIVRGKASRPAYGHFRLMVDLEMDEKENGSDPLVSHRNLCEKCRTAHAHEQSKRKKGRKRKTKDDDSEDEETRIAKLGGWVRW